MRTQVSTLIAGFVIAAALASAPAQADVSWTGPGWYVEGTSLGMDFYLDSGPYADKSACEAAQPANDDDYDYYCEYEQTDPNADGG